MNFFFSPFLFLSLSLSLSHFLSGLFENGYHDTNPFHNSIHAADVTQAMHCFIEEEKIGQFLTPMEKMCSLLAAVTHDLDHPGVNQHFLIATKSHLASLYNVSHSNYHQLSFMIIFISLCIMITHLSIFYPSLYHMFVCVSVSEGNRLRVSTKLSYFSHR